MRDDYDFALLRSAVRHEVLVLGICRGLQAVNVFFGGTLYQDLPSEFPFRAAENHSCGAVKKTAGDILHGIEVMPGTRLADVAP
ncbi:MAG: gamma-glutamyl-gamma-aminobutyrate hydrolase family protein, partial [Kiritimatiellae bacterium]|nr:gamma-glutamyl-gamma-aminobutyrate hydrolase family protein [Kiritimatiellia bacterium]